MHYFFSSLRCGQNNDCSSLIEWLNYLRIFCFSLQSWSKAQRKIKLLGFEYCVSARVEDVLSADRIILPGVGHFGKAMQNLKELQLIESLNEAVLIKKTPILGICLGMQLMARSSEEGNSIGLGWFDAEVVPFTVSDTFKFKVPHTGWNSIQKQKESSINKGLSDE